MNNTTNVTNYVTVNNYIINRSVDVTRVERAAGRRIAAVEARDVVRRNASITTVDQGSRVQENERRQHGGNRNASARERIVALPESRARAIAPPVGGGQDRDRIDRVIGPPPGRDNGKGKATTTITTTCSATAQARTTIAGGPDVGNNNNNNNNNAPNLQRDRANDRQGGPNGPGQNNLGQNNGGQNQAITRQQDRAPRPEPQRPQARQQAPQNEGPPQAKGGGNNTNQRIDRQPPPDREPRGADKDRNTNGRGEQPKTRTGSLEGLMAFLFDQDGRQDDVLGAATYSNGSGSSLPPPTVVMVLGSGPCRLAKACS